VSAITAEVEYPPVRCRDDESAVVESLDAVGRLEKASHLGREDVLVARTAPEGGPEPALGETEPVMRGGVEVPDAQLPGPIDCCQYIGVRHLTKEASELRTPSDKVLKATSFVRDGVTSSPSCRR
jgi:hypothetical protein